MLSTTDFHNGLAIIYKDEPWIITKFQHVKPGKGGSFTRTKLKNLKNAKALEVTFKTGEQFVDPDLIHKRLQYLYNDEEKYYFMAEDYQQYELGKEIVGEAADFMKEECKVDGLFMGDSLFNIQLPPKMDFKVTESPPGIKGDTATTANKKVVIETGASVNVPLFIKEGDIIKINTETGEYVSRAN